MPCAKLHYAIPALPQRPPLRCVPAPTLTPASPWRQLVARIGKSLAAARERRRVMRAYREDLRALAGMGERDLADFCAPCWLRSDVARFR